MRAQGLCEYCRISENFTLAQHEIDRIIALKHGGQNRWDDHYVLRNVEIVGSTASGRATVRLLRMNRPTRITERQLLADRGQLPR